MVEHVPRHEVIAKLGKFRRYRLNQRQERNNAGIAQLVEHDLAKVGVASSNLVSRSKLAEWQNGYAADCKSVDLGSTPGSASIIALAIAGSNLYQSKDNPSPGGEIGRHKGFKIPRW